MPRSRRWQPAGRVIEGTVRPLRGAAAVRADGRLGQYSVEELERGQVTGELLLDPLTGETTVVPSAGLDRSSVLVDLIPSGARGVPLTVERPLRVAAPAGGSRTTFGAVDTIEPPPNPDLPRLWPWLFPPGADGGEFPIVRASAVAIVGVGATVSLITLAEVPRGMAGVVKAFGQTAADFTDLTWTFLVKNRPTAPIIAINFQFGELFRPTPLPGSGVLLGPGDDFVVQVTNPGVAIVGGVRARVDLYLYRA